MTTSTLDPQVEYLLNGVARANMPSYPEMGILAARQHYEKVAPSLCVKATHNMHIEEHVIQHSTAATLTRWYWPSLPCWATPQAALVWFHGGGFNIGSIATAHHLCAMLATQTNCVVISVDYRLAPEFTFPCAYEDAWGVLSHLIQHGTSYGIDYTRIAVGGESAGGALAASCAINARNHGLQLAGQLLVTPHTQLNFQTESHQAFAKGFLLDQTLIKWFFNNYLTHNEHSQDWRFAPACANNHQGLAPTLLILASHDPLRDDGLHYHHLLQQANVSSTYKLYDGMIHGFFGMGGAIQYAKHAHQEAISFLKNIF